MFHEISCGLDEGCIAIGYRQGEILSAIMELVMMLVKISSLSCFSCVNDRNIF